MNRYSVDVPISGVAHVTVEADDPAEAAELALEAVTDVDEWSAYDQVAGGGGVWYSDYPSEIEITDVEEDIDGEGDK